VAENQFTGGKKVEKEKRKQGLKAEIRIGPEEWTKNSKETRDRGYINSIYQQLFVHSILEKIAMYNFIARN